jgi:hypothetical protein
VTQPRKPESSGITGCRIESGMTDFDYLIAGLIILREEKMQDNYGKIVDAGEYTVKKIIALLRTPPVESDW